MTTKTTKFVTEGMHCPSCSMLIEMSLTDVEGVAVVASDYKSGVTEVTYDAGLLSDETLVSEIKKAGYTARVA